MNESIIAVRYAKALFQLAVEKNKADVLKNDMETLYHSIEAVSELKALFYNPVVKPGMKTNIIREVFGSFDADTLGFLTLLIQNRREEYIEEIALNFIKRYRKYKGIEKVIFTTAIKIDGDIESKIKQQIGKYLKADVEFESQVDERLIGGFRLRLGDKQYDASISTKLEDLKRKLVKTSIH
ncbi:MAG TPA: ATP synthase F1 subunit delta [Bacteroidales bacterium]|nr:ATP synthase F1 subunit delta [Bacteroidales bacterium]